MRQLILCLLVVCLAACSGDHDQSHATDPLTPACTKIVSSVERLACFDTVAGTPIPSSAKTTVTPASASSDQSAVAPPLIVSLVRRNELSRKKEDHHFLLLRSQDDDGHATQIVISAPALGSGEPRPLLAISCLSGITRLQFITSQPIPQNRLRLRLRMDDQPPADDATWQVLEGGTIADAGRGLVAIDTLKRMPAGHRLQTDSDYAPLDGLIFDASDLHDLLTQQREACHW